MDAREIRAELRGAVARGDDTSLIALLREGPWPEHALQLIGDGLSAALARQVDGAGDLALACVAALRERGWEGDEELATGLESRLGAAPAPLLRSLAVDLDDLAAVLEGDPVHGGGRVDLRTGEVWPQAAIEYALETGEEDEDDQDDPERWLWVECEGSHAGYRDMESFIASIDDPQTADRLSIAISGRGAFRRFKDLLARYPEVRDRWFAYSEDRQRGRARAWLVAEGYAASPREPYQP